MCMGVYVLHVYAHVYDVYVHADANVDVDVNAFVYVDG